MCLTPIANGGKDNAVVNCFIIGSTLGVNIDYASGTLVKGNQVSECTYGLDSGGVGAGSGVGAGTVFIQN